MTETMQRDATKERLAALGRKDLLWLKKQLRRELHRRWVDGRADAVRKRHGWIGLANFMAGVTWALACRDALRRSKGHLPTWGKRPQSGEMWLPKEMLTALRADIKDRGWSPLAAGCWSDVHSRLTHVRGAESDEPFAVQFAVRMAGETAAARIPL